MGIETYTNMAEVSRLLGYKHQNQVAMNLKEKRWTPWIVKFVSYTEDNRPYFTKKNLEKAIAFKNAIK